MDELAGPVVVEFPLRGEDWLAVNSPADRIPSHGTDLLAQRYAFDFIRVDRRERGYYHRAGLFRTLVLGVPTRECYAWGAAIHAPFDGEVVRAVDGVEERSLVHPARELFHVLTTSATFTPERLPAILGNHVLLRRRDGIHAAFAHLAPGSVAVAPGDRALRGDVIGRVGHTGNSTSPHLHFQLMDSADVLNASGLPCAFRGYEVARDGAWHPVVDGVPGRRERIRSTGPASGRASHSPR